MDNGYAPPIASAGPRTIICYICGRQYGIHSYDIHLKQCKDLWIARESQKPVKERKPLPTDPMLGRGASAGGAVNGNGNGGSRGGGSRGGGGGGRGGGDAMRSESPSRGGAGGGGVAGMSAADIAAMNAAAQDTYNNVSLSQCEWCGRSFLAEKLAIHNRSCTQDNPARRVTDPVKRGDSINSREVVAPSPSRRPKTSDSAERRQRPPLEGDRMGATAVPPRGELSGGVSRSMNASPLTAAGSPLTAKRGVTRIEPVAEQEPPKIVSFEDDNSDSYNESQMGSPMRGPSGRSLRHKRPSPIKEDPKAKRNYDIDPGSSSSDEESKRYVQNSGAGAERKEVSPSKQSKSGSKAETIRYLTQRVDDIELQAVALVKSVQEIKALLKQL